MLGLISAMEFRTSGDDLAPVCPGSVAHSEVAVEAGVLGAGEIGGHQRAFVERVVFGILHDADYFDFAGMIRRFSDGEAMADGRTIGKEAAGHALVDDGDFW